MKSTVEKMLEKYSYSEAMSQILTSFQRREISPFTRDNILSSYSKCISEMKEESISVILDYAETALDDDALSQEEMTELRTLKRFLKIGDVDFLQYRKEDKIKHIISRQLRLMVADKRIDKDESLMKNDIQELFGLSYDQYLEYEQEIVEEALQNGADIHDLDTFYEF